jgi:hypothetical protein
MDKDTRAKFARLLALSKIREAQILANPLPELDRYAEEIHRLRTALDQAYHILAGFDDLSVAQDLAPHMPPDLVELCTVKNRRAADVISKALFSRPT